MTLALEKYNKYVVKVIYYNFVGHLMTDISPEQIRAARGLLNWRQYDLAKACGLSAKAVNQLECGKTIPRSSSLRLVREALAGAGVVFLGSSGVRLVEEQVSVEMVEGAKIVARLTEDILSCMKDKNDEYLMCAVDEKLFAKLDAAQHTRYQQAAQRIGFRERFLAPDTQTMFLSSKNSYRVLPKKLLGVVPYFLYADRMAVMFWNKRPRRLLIIRNASLNETFRMQFNLLWGIAKKPL